MSSQALNLFIVDDNPLQVTGLRNYLDMRFGAHLNISAFYSGESALKKVDDTTSIVILDYFLEGENGNEVLESIKKINPQTQVIMLSSNEDVAVAIESLQKGATDFVLKGENSWKRLTNIVYGIIMFPIRVLVREFGISKYLAIFLLAFISVGIGVYLVMKFTL